MIGRGKNQLLYTHRLALILAGLDPLPGQAACHACDNPPCCNPAHLFWGSDAENMADSVGKGRRHTNACHRGHPRTPENTHIYIRKDGKVHRTCRPCDRMRDQRGRKKPDRRREARASALE